MADTSVGNVSGTDNPYQTGSYTPGTTDKNTLTITGYFQLLAAQLQNQDMTNPMDNSEMMAQMTQMAMVQSMQAMTSSIDTSTAVSVSTYAASLVNQEVTVAVTEDNGYGQEVAVDVKYGVVESVNLTGSSPTIKLKDDDKEYPISYVLGLGKLPNPYDDGEDEDGEETGTQAAAPGGFTAVDFLKTLQNR